jgi:hypothetical protein
MDLYTLKVENVEWLMSKCIINTFVRSDAEVRRTNPFHANTPHSQSSSSVLRPSFVRVFNNTLNALHNSIL